MNFWNTLLTLHKAVDGTEYIRFRSTERSSKMTGRCDTDSRVTAQKIFSTVMPTKRMCTLRRYSSFSCADLDPYVLARIYLKNCNVHNTTGSDVYKQISPEIPPREYNLQTCSANPGSSSDC